VDIRTVTVALLGGQLNRDIAAVAFQGFNTLLRSIEIQRKLDHQQELEDQLAELRDRLQEVKRTRWGV
jgi:hypothetical protein